MDKQLKQKEIAEFLNVSPAAIKTFTTNGMPHIMVGKTPRYDRSEVLVWLKEVTPTLEDKLAFELEKLKVGSCTCTTKTPELIFHTKNCMYRRIQDVIDSL